MSSWPPQSRGSVGSFWTHSQLSLLHAGAGSYGCALRQAAERRPGPIGQQIVAFDEPMEVVVVSATVLADDLASALDRSLGGLFALIDQANLDQPGRIELLAGHLA